MALPNTVNMIANQSFMQPVWESTTAAPRAAQKGLSNGILEWMSLGRWTEGGGREWSMRDQVVWPNFAYGSANGGSHTSSGSIVTTTRC